MKKILIFSTFVILVITLNAQSGDKFDYVPTQFNIFQVSPNFNKSKGEGKLGSVIFTDEKYLINLVYNPIKNIFSESKLKSIHISSGLTIIFNSKGDVINLRFLIDARDTAIISEDDLYNLYSSFMKIKIDMSKVKMHPLSLPSDQGEFDYAEIAGSFLPLEYRRKIK